MSGFGITETDDALGIRFGIGLQYNINKHYTLRGSVRHVVLDMDAVDNLTEFSVGLRYNF